MFTAAQHHDKSQYTHRCRNIPGLAWIQILEKRVWRAGIFLRTLVVHLESGADYIPISWSLWKYGRKHCSHQSSPCRGHNAQSYLLGPSPRSEGRKHPGSHWYTHRCGSHLSGICWKKVVRLFIMEKLNERMLSDVKLRDQLSQVMTVSCFELEHGLKHCFLPNVSNNKPLYGALL